MTQLYLEGGETESNKWVDFIEALEPEERRAVLADLAPKVGVRAEDFPEPDSETT